MYRSSHDSPLGRRSRGDGSSNSTERRFINVSSDGSILRYSQPGINYYGDPSLVMSVINSRKVIGDYSEDSERNFVNDRSHLHFLLKKYLPNDEAKEKVVDLDLNISQKAYHGYATTGKKDSENFLTWIINNKEAFYKEFGLSSLSKDGGKFVLHKNILTNLLVVPYNMKREFKYYAYSFDGVVYFQKEYIDITNNNISVWGHKFEQLMTDENPSNDVTCNEEFRAVISNNLGPHQLLVSAALDCANPDEFVDGFKDLSSFITLKTLQGQTTDSYSYRFHMLMWYLNYVFLGVPKTLVGNRNRYGVVKFLKLYDAADLLLLGKDSWNPTNCLFFASEALSFIKKNVESEPGSVFCVKKESGKPMITCNKEPDYENFLPEWFTQEILETKRSDCVKIVDKDEE